MRTHRPLLYNKKEVENSQLLLRMTTVLECASGAITAAGILPALPVPDDAHQGKGYDHHHDADDYYIAYIVR